MRSVQAVGSELIEVNTHDFGNCIGFTGVALLAKSIISARTQPEHRCVAVDQLAATPAYLTEIQNSAPQLYNRPLGVKSQIEVHVLAY